MKMRLTEFGTMVFCLIYMNNLNIDARLWQIIKKNGMKTANALYHSVV